MQGPDPEDPVCTTRAAEPVLPELGKGIGGLRVAVGDRGTGQDREGQECEEAAHGTGRGGGGSDFGTIAGRT